jgi:hypothetical protein
MKLTIVDTFEVKPDYHGSHAPGLVIVASAESPVDAESAIGGALLVTTSTGSHRFVVAEAKQHGQQVSFFLPQLVLGDVIPGSTVHLEPAATPDSPP